ncbi:MAG: flagellar biosynthetic protein FliO [Gammaproteobacteria bacterium]|nr:flagellar biosynthetic protein FliO [Gammaproteobacteria bacterium]
MRAAFILLLALPGRVSAADVEPSRIESTVFAGGILVQLTLGLLLVLALAVGLSWLLRRYALPRDGLVRVIGGLPLGARERLLLIEVDEVRLLIGITAHQIQALHVFTPSISRPADSDSPMFQITPLCRSPEPLHDPPPS